MPTYRGNVGNLLQHWVLCEILDGCHGHANHLAFIDAYSMAPLATERPTIDQYAPPFDHVRDQLPGQRTTYEKSWHHLVPNANGYPNSAAFLTSVWQSEYSLLLCEMEPLTVAVLRAWADDLVGSSPRCIGVEVFVGNWRERFSHIEAPASDIVLVSFDPYMFNRHDVAHPQPGNMYPGDVQLLATMLKQIPQGVIVQLSTYSANNGNAQNAVIESIREHLNGCGLEVVATPAPNGSMMSIVLTRNIPWSDSFRNLAPRFAAWLEVAA